MSSRYSVLADLGTDRGKDVSDEVERQHVTVYRKSNTKSWSFK